MAAEIPFRIFEKPCDYGEILEFQENLRSDVIAKNSDGCVLFLEHNPVYTSGLRGKEDDFIKPIGDIPVYNIRRGGELTFHGPGQLVIYPVIDFRSYGFASIKEFVLFFADSIKSALSGFCGVENLAWHDEKAGLWVEDRKIAFTGMHFKKFVPIHGFSINISNDLSYFSKIVPCGIPNCKITSVKEETGKVYQVKDVAEEIIAKINGRDK
ncbi:lipoyl(octanoyl) transferase LipB [bacterium]|nr:lipoyl(octanoyl) transferase LipB [bacterium]